MHGQHDHFGARHGARDFARRFKTTDPRHVHVHQDDICGISPAPLDGVLAAAGFASDFNPFLYLPECVVSLRAPVRGHQQEER